MYQEFRDVQKHLDRSLEVGVISNGESDNRVVGDNEPRKKVLSVKVLCAKLSGDTPRIFEMV